MRGEPGLFGLPAKRLQRAGIVSRPRQYKRPARAAERVQVEQDVVRREQRAQDICDAVFVGHRVRIG